MQECLGHLYYYYSVASLGLLTFIPLWITLYWKGGAGATVAALAFQRGKRRPWALLPAVTIVLAATLSTRLDIPLQPVERLLNDQTSGREYVWRDAVQGWQTAPIGGVGPYQGGPYLTYLFKDGCQLTPTLKRNKISCPDALSR